MLASEREESAGASWKEVWSERQAIDAASAQEDPSRKGSVSTLLSFVDSREDAPSEFGCIEYNLLLLTLRTPAESPGYSTTSCRSTSPSILFSPRQTHVTNSSISSLAPSSRATTTAASPTIFSSSYKITNPPPKSSAPATKLQRKSAIVVESENGLAKSQKQSGSREEPAPNNPRFVFPKPRPLEMSVISLRVHSTSLTSRCSAQSASHPFRVQSTSIAPVPSVFDPLPDSPKSKIISPALLAQPASDTLNSTHPAFQHKAPHPYRSSIASSFDSTYQQPYSFCQTFAFPHPALRKAHIDRSKSSAFSRRVPEADELSFRGVLKENQASQKEREEWQGRGRYPSDGGFRTPRRRRVFSEADGRSREWSPGYFRGRSGSMDAAIVGEQPPSPTVAHCSTLFSHLLPRRSGTLGANSTARHSTPEFHLFRRHSRKRSDATYPHTVYEKPLRRSASEETLVIRSISPEIQLGTAISNTSPAPSSPRARIVSTDEKEFVALPPRLRHSFSKSASDFFPRQQPPPLSLQTPDTSPVRRYRTPLSEGEARMQQEARLNLLLHQKLVAENDTRSPPVKTPLRLNKDLPPITPELVGSSRLSRKNTLEKAPDAPLPPLPNTPLLVTPPSARLSDSKLSNGSLHVPESPLDRDMLGGHYLSSPRGDREGSEGTSILDMDDEDDLYYRDLVSLDLPSFRSRC